MKKKQTTKTVINPVSGRSVTIPKGYKIATIKEFRHPGIMLSHFLEALKIPLDEFSEMAGIDLPLLEGIIAGEKSVNMTLSKKITKAFKVSGSGELWFNLQKSYDENHGNS